MEDPVKVSITCGNPECGRQFKFNKPAKPGNYGINCPFCSTKNLFKVAQQPANPENPPQQPATGLLEDGSYRFLCANDSCRQAVKVPAAMVRKGINKVMCPKCHTENTFEIEPSEEDLLLCQTHECSGKLDFANQHGDGVFTAECPVCQAEYRILVQDSKILKVSQVTPPPFPSLLKRPPMKLVLDKLFGKREYLLAKGSHTVGRLDDVRPSDFMVNDKFASAQSLRIDVNLTGEEIRYKMTVVNATNPVYHNNMELVAGDIVYLDYSDTIKIGKTLIKVQKCKSK